ncbi:MAG: T9SS type A sorting domain-containing protein [Bacteroidota bacterium]
MKNFHLLAALCCTFILSNTFAQSHNWTGNGGDSDWFNTANWDSGTVPIETSTVSIVGNVMVLISGSSAEAYTIDLHNNATLEMQSNLETQSIITVHDSGTFIFTTGVLSGSGVHNFGLLKVEGINTRTFSNTSVTNHADFLVTNSNQTQLFNTTINNMTTGLIDISSVGGFLQQNQSSVINNDGLLRKSPDGLNPFGTFYLITEINNQGTIEVQEDQTFLLLAGSSTFTNFENGRVTGNGVYDITTNFVNHGLVLPGGDETVGSLDVTNNFSLNGGIVSIDMAGTANGEFDSIVVVGGPQMEGALDINLLFEPQVGDEFEVITWNLSGSNCNFPQFTTAIRDGFEYTFETFCNANDVTLRMVGVSVLGFEDLGKEEVQFYVYPNPVSETGHFVFSSEFIASETSKVVLYNALGQQVSARQGISPGSDTFERGNLPGGLYFAQLEDEGRVLATTRIVID